MNFRLTAFSLHLASSAAVLTLVLGALYLGWYRWPGWYLTEALHVIALVLIVDLLLGPVLTLTVANPVKPRKVFARDLAVILVVQVIALAFGTVTLWLGRPLYYTFSVDRLELVQSSEVTAKEATLGLQQNASLAPHWYSLPRWVWVPLPQDPAEAAHIVNSALLTGVDVIQMPRYFRPWERGLDQLRKELARVDDLSGLSGGQKHSLRRDAAELGLATEERNAMILWGARRAVVIFDPVTLEEKAILKVK